MKISIIIPTLNEASQITDCLNALQPLRETGHEVIVVDGGSDDGTVDCIAELADHLLQSAPGRASQMNHGARAACGDLLLFLHADTRIDSPFDEMLGELAGSDRSWGRFKLRLSGDRFIYRVIEFFINLRSRLTGIATGDQAIFVSRLLFDESGGYPDIPLMEDIELSRRLRRHCWPQFIGSRVITSSRRWESGGVVRTVFRMWWLRFRFALGAPASVLARHYD